MEDKVLIADVGGNIGDTLAFFGCAFENHRVSKLLVFECEPSNIEMLIANTRQLAESRNWQDARIRLVEKAVVADGATRVTLHINKSVYNRYRDSTYSPTTKDTRPLTVNACNLLTELVGELHDSQYTVLLLKIDIEGAEFPLLDTILDWMTALQAETHGLQRIKLMLEYSLDQERKLAEWFRRRDLCCSVFDTVLTKRKYSQVDLMASHVSKNTNNADIWRCDWKRRRTL